ncbi:TrkH family potassium uptake protein [Dethiobacter alkaliphilus]|uniref:Potassium uptake protein, TrkH family n=1 Tax=Dethiobacter alkaliphilus AHT 1 TaxID=555088 RepID=C0GJM7_DETAL|nr:TrkH family potassium uptake protein [Dethiobacter alkaliphilus]EEG76449.1 potassium uptake protein, TrkH family [Dethiobacter alkaliphilus AHT 1]
MQLNPFQAPKVSPAKILVVGFAAVIFIGALLLTLPIATHSGQISFLDALFTATSAVCVTGLVVVDTGTYFTVFGQTVIMILIQIGGLGIMTAATVVFILLGKKITLRERLVIKEAMNQITMEGLVRLVQIVILLTFAVEAVGALLLSTRFIPEYGLGTGLFYSVFHAVSAFSNAGFDLIGEGRSLTPFANDPVILLTIAALFILGGLGFSVVMEFYQKRRLRRLTLHTKMVLIISSVLLVLGTVIIFVMEYNNPETLGQLGFLGKVLNAFFTSATTRTAGFNSVPTGGLLHPTLFFMLALMFIGASPGSTGGGIKTTTFGGLLVAVISTIRGSDDPVIFKKQIPVEILRRALSIAVISITLVFLVTLLLLITEGGELLPVFFEAMSAFGTVGLSTGITGELSPLGRIIIIITMFAGRLGPLTLMFALARRMQKKSPIRYTSERIMLG